MKPHVGLCSGGASAAQGQRAGEGVCMCVFEEARRGFQLGWDARTNNKFNPSGSKLSESVVAKAMWYWSATCTRGNKCRTGEIHVLRTLESCKQHLRSAWRGSEVFSDVFRDGTTGSQPIPVFGDLNDVRGRWKRQRELRLRRSLVSTGRLRVRA